MSSIKYNPNPPRVWSRVQNRCSTDSADSTVDYAKIDYDRQMLLKGNILQYKKNSSNLTKNQRYTQIAKGMWTNRTKTWATQSDTYTNPNNSSLLRVNNTILDPSNNTFSNRSNPFNCPTTEIQDGGNLVCSVVVNPCTQEVIKRSVSQQLCNPTTDSDVPGQIQQLCWNDGTQTWYPRQRYTMGNSGTSWPEGYKGFVSAFTLEAPVLTLESSNNNSVTLSWTAISNDCMPISSFNIYQNEILIGNVLYPIRTITIDIICGINEYKVTSLSNVIESVSSNIVSYSNIILAPTLSLTYNSPNVIDLSWNLISNADSYKVYQTGVGLILNTSSTNTTISIICGYYSYYVTACITGTDCESEPSIPKDYTNTIASPNLSLTYNSPNVIDLSWNLISNADSYKVYQTGVGLILNTSSTNTTISIICGSYSYYVTACISGTTCESIPSNSTNYTNTIASPTLSLAYNNPNVIDLSWNLISNANSYKVYQNGINTITTNTNNATISIICGSYSYYVTACISGTTCESIPSNSTNYTNTIASPTNLTLTASTNVSTITLNWVLSNNADSYKVYQNGSYIQTTTTNTATITGLTYNTNYSFYVTACISGTTCESTSSNTVTYSFPMYTATGTYTTTTSGGYTYLAFSSNGSIYFSGHTDNIQIICAGGGGGGGGGNYTSSSWWAGSGGGGGGIGSLNGSINKYQTYNITVGAKGNGGYGVNGNKGGDSSFGSLITSTGGGGGIFVENNSSANGGTGGTSSCSSSVFTSYTGGNGGAGGEGPTNGTSTFGSMPITTLGGLTYSFSGGGGGGSTNPSYYGGYAGKNGLGGAINYPYSTGENAITLGAGGGGASHYNEPYGGTQGGNGAPGYVIVIFLT